MIEMSPDVKAEIEQAKLEIKSAPHSAAVPLINPSTGAASPMDESNRLRATEGVARAIYNKYRRVSIILIAVSIVVGEITAILVGTGSNFVYLVLWPLYLFITPEGWVVIVLFLLVHLMHRDAKRNPQNTFSVHAAGVILLTTCVAIAFMIFKMLTTEISDS